MPQPARLLAASKETIADALRHFNGCPILGPDTPNVWPSPASAAAVEVPVLGYSQGRYWQGNSPQPFANDSVRDSDRVPYLWNVGRVKQPAVSMQDFAVVTRIDDSVIPSKYKPGAGGEPLRAWRMKIPAGTHTVEILKKEAGLRIPSPLVIGPLNCIVVEKASRWVEFTVEPDCTYVPVVDQKCGKKWTWIADSGPTLPRSGRGRDVRCAGMTGESEVFVFQVKLGVALVLTTVACWPSA